MAAVLVGALVWFGRVWIPAQQQYLNERNLRALKTIAQQVKARVDNFDSAIDHAIDSFQARDGETTVLPKVELLRKYVRLFAPELEILTLDNSADPAAKPAAAAKITPGDPPNVRTLRADGRNFLYLGYRHDASHRNGLQSVSLTARADIEQAAGSYLLRTDFDAMLLLDSRGVAIAQQSSSGLELTGVDGFRDRVAPPAGTPAKIFDRIRGTTSLMPVTIGAADYMLYAQPVQLSLMHDGSTQTAEEWTLCALVRLDRFRAASSTIPTTYWLVFGAVLAVICFAIPLVKLHVLSPRERLRRFDAVSATASICLMMALATFILCDVHVFGVLAPPAVDARLQAVAASISTHVQQETQAVEKQMTAFDSDEVWQQKLGYLDEEEHSLADVRNHLKASDGADINLEAGAASRSQCKPSWSCRAGVLRDLGKAIDYPFFKLMVWSDDGGWQRIKWSTSPVVTPFINVDEAKLAYSDSMKLARRFGASDPRVPATGVTLLTSPNTGEKLTVFWRALKVPPGPSVDRVKTDLLGETLATVPVSLTSLVLPKHVQFAVLDRTGRVLFHSDAARTLSENFIQESEDSPTLKSLVAGRDRGGFSGRYLGRGHRFFVTPLDLKPFGDPRWTLVVFQDAAVGETANLETLNLAASMFAFYVIALAAVWAVLGIYWPRLIDKWLWPDRAKGARYLRAGAAAAAAGLAGVAASALLPPMAVLIVTALLIAGGVVSAFAILRAQGEPAGEPPAAWFEPYFGARAALVFLLAAVPAMACFHVAHAFQTELAARRAYSYLASELNARTRRINTQARRVALCTERDPGNQSCPEVGVFVKRRTMETLWDVAVPAVHGDGARAGRSLFASTALGSFLRSLYRPYNEIAADALMTSVSQPTGGLEAWRLAVDPQGNETFAGGDRGWSFAPAVESPSPIGGGTLLMAAALLGVAYLLVRYLLEPLFLTSLDPPAALLTPAGAADEGSLLILGPCGSQRSERLHQRPGIRVFDVRSLTFTDRPVSTVPSAVQVSTAADGGHAIVEGEMDWPEALHLATAQPPAIVGLDHLDHRFDDQAFRERLLPCLEAAVYERGATIWCSAARDPIECLGELDPPAADGKRWARLFDGFHREQVGLAADRDRAATLAKFLNDRRVRLAPSTRARFVAECEVAPELLTIGEHLAYRLPFDAQADTAGRASAASHRSHVNAVSEEALLTELGRAAEPFYAWLWNGCSRDQRVALRQLAEEDLVNPNNGAAIARLWSAGLVRRDAAFHVMNETFRRFIVCAESPERIAEWEREGVRVPWATIATTGVTVVFGLAGLLLLTQEQLVDAWIGYVPAFAPAIPTVWKVLANVQKGRVDVTA